MTALGRKEQILEGAGYRYNFDREIYFNRKTKKAFSADFVEDHTENDLERCISEQERSREWHFFFNSPASDAVKRELANLLG